jgi:pSer/pThr/pTyr-binding forkhead associated (FHA) protein
LHLHVSYDARSHTICISDLGSANGTYINGQRLHPHEVRVLRDHDEMRLGKLVMLASFRRQ